jgi:peptide/nickel transport system substrate-binding protein
MKSRVRLRLVTGGILGLTVAALAAGATTYAAPSESVTIAATPHKCLVATGSGDPAFVRNFNPYVQGLPTSDFARGAFYEPLVITTPAGGGRQHLWLAKKLTWSKDARTLTIDVRDGVKWSDGKPLTAKDVVYSLTAGRQDKSMDLIALTTPTTNIAAIKQVGSDGRAKVAITLKSPDSQFVGDRLQKQFVVPEHVFSKIDDMSKFTNPNPVSTGPFNRIASFSTQSYTLNKNPSYWQKGAPKIPCLRRIAASSNDAALLQIVSGQADWTHNFVPNVEKAYVAKDPKHYHAFYDTTALPIGLFFDVTKYPYSLIPFRHAVSQAIDRNKVSRLGEYGYAPPTDAIGIAQLFPTWVDKTVAADAKRLATYNAAAAKRTLTQAGFTYKGDDLYDPKGNRVGFSVHVIGGWSDWVASLQIISKNLQDIGIDASVKLEPDWGSWYSNATSTKFVTLLWQAASVASPYGYFWEHFHRDAFVPSGEDAFQNGNYEHYWNSTGTKLLDQWKNTLDRKKQQAIAGKLQALFVQKMPFVPLFIGPQWSTYSTKYVHCFPTKQNHYTRPIFNNAPENSLALVRICPGGSP